MQNTDRNLPSVQGKGLILLIPTLLFFIIAFILLYPSEIGWDFQNNLWAPAHLLLQSKSPYNIHVFIEQANAVWLPFGITIFLPLGALPGQQAYNLWILIETFSLFGILYLYSKHWKKGLKTILFFFFLFVLFPPVMTNFVLGQISLIIVFVFSIILLQWDTLSPILMGLLIAFTLSKPQLCIYILPAIFLVNWKHHSKKRAFRIAGFSILWCLLLLIPFYLFYPRWLQDLLINLELNHIWMHPNLTTYFSDWTGLNRLIFNIPLALIGFALTLFVVLRLPPQKALAWSLVLTPQFTPYIWSWDFVFVFPLLLETILSAPNTKKRWIFLGGFILAEIVFIVMKVLGYYSDHFYWWFPIIINALLLAGNLPCFKPAKTY